MPVLPLTRRALLAGTAGAAALMALRGQAQAQSQPGEPARGGRLVVASDSEPSDLNPAVVASNGVFFVASKVVEPLADASYDGKDGLSPRLATAWSGSADGRSVTFTLRENVLWHDGQPFTSADVAYSALEVWKTLQNLGRVVFKNLESVDTPDAHTAVLRFSEATPFQLVRNALPALTAVLPAHVFKGTDVEKNPASEKLIGTGPFKYAEHKPGEYYRLVRNELYWDKARPYLDEIVYQVLPDRTSASAALEAGDIGLAAFSAVPLADLDRIGKEGGLKVYTNGYEALTYQLVVEINHRRKELADPHVRQAIAHAIDHDAVVKTVFLGYAKPSTGPVPAYDKTFYNAGVPKLPYDPAAAERLLDEAGLKRGSDGTRLKLTLRPAPFFNETVAFGAFLKQALEKVGIDATIVSADTPAHLKAVYTDHDFDLAVGSPVYRADPAISTTILFQGGLPAGVPFSNQYGYANPAVDKLIAAAASELDDTKRADLYKQVQALVVGDVALINVAEFSFTTVARDTVHNVSSNPRWAVSNWADAWVQQG